MSFANEDALWNEDMLYGKDLKKRKRFDQNELRDKVGKRALFDKHVLSLAQHEITN